MKCLVTGGAGFIGSHIVDALLDDGHKVRVIDNLSTGNMANFPFKDERVEFWHADIDNAIIADGACQDIDYVFHLAAIPSVQRSIENPLKTQRAGEEATLKLLMSAAKHKIKRFIFSASSAAYGDNTAQEEDTAPRPMSPYAASKVACEGYVAAYAMSLGVDGVSLRYFNVFGPRQDPSSQYSGVISIFLKKLREGKQPTIFGSGLQCRDFTYIENVVSANMLAMNHPYPLKGEVFNIGCGLCVNLKEYNKIPCVRVPQHIHVGNSGPSPSYAATLNWAVRDYAVKNNCEIIALMHSDLFPICNVSVSEILGEHIIASTVEFRLMDGGGVNYLYPAFTIINMKLLKEPSQLDFGLEPGLDVGGKTKDFIKNNALGVKFLPNHQPSYILATLNEEPIANYYRDDLTICRKYGLSAGWIAEGLVFEILLLKEIQYDFLVASMAGRMRYQHVEFQEKWFLHRHRKRRWDGAKQFVFL